MQRRQSLQINLESTTERGIQGVTGAPERVASEFGPGEDFEGGGAWGLKFVGDVGVPELNFGELGRVAGAFVVLAEYDCCGG